MAGHSACCGVTVLDVWPWLGHCAGSRLLPALQYTSGAAQVQKASTVHCVGSILLQWMVHDGHVGKAAGEKCKAAVAARQQSPQTVHSTSQNGLSTPHSPHRTCQLQLHELF